MTQTTTRPAANPDRVNSGHYEDYLERVRSIVPLIREHATETEAERTIAAPVAEELDRQRLHWVMLPEALGGGGLTLVEGLKLVEEVSKADASTGWAWMASAFSTAYMAGLLEPEVNKELLDQERPAVIAGQLLPRFPAAKVDGGYVVDATFSFASGSDHASWIGAGILVADGGGNLILDENGEPEARVALFPKDEVVMRRNWDVWGLVGTGSHDYTIEKKFVPDNHTVLTFAGTPTRPEPMYRLGNAFLGALPHAGVALGIAARTLELAARATSGKRRVHYQVPVGESDLFRYEFAKHEALYQAARLFVHDVVGSAEACVAAGGQPTPDMLARGGQAVTWMQGVATQIAQFAHSWSGSAAIGSTSELGRLMRDAEVAQQHLLVDPMTLVTAAGRILPTYLDGSK
jgi:indole-3-acetate monooxygenase